MKVKERGYLHIFRNLLSAADNKDVYGILRHTQPCLLPFPQSAIYFTHLSRLVLEKHAQNVNNPAEKLGALGLTFGI